jgi:predicted nucleic acid-binding Zn ribbon protein
LYIGSHFPLSVLACDLHDVEFMRIPAYLFKCYLDGEAQNLVQHLTSSERTLHFGGIRIKKKGRKIKQLIKIVAISHL